MSYELLALPVPPGAEIEEAGEALEVRLAGGHVFRDATAAGDARRRALAAVAVGADPSLAVAEEDAPHGRIVLAADDGVEVEIDSSFVALRVAYDRSADEAEHVFDRLFRIISAVVQETGWRVYDPQEARAVDAGDAGRDTTLEIFLTVLDQLRPGNGFRVR